MFKDESLESITITSDIKEEKYVRDQLCQTKPLKTISIATQAIERHAIETQTDFEQELPNKTRIKLDTSKNLSNFLLLVYPVISDQLIANTRSHAFDGYEVDWNENDDLENEMTCIHVLKNENAAKQKVTAVTWNSTGSVVGAALGFHDHETWCVHQSYVCLWNIDRSNIDTKKPDKVIDSDTCVMAISFHLSQPALLAGGDFSGKIYIWDMSQEDNPLVAYSGKDTISHQEPVTEVAWKKSVSLRTHALVSVASDGRILIWEFNQLKKELKISQKFLLQGDNIPRAMRLSLNKDDIKIGITCLVLSPHENDTLFFGTETGAVLKCLTSMKSGTSTSDPDFLSPSVQAFKGHIGIVNAIDVSPLLSDIFLTCGSDMTIHVYSTGQVTPLIVLEPGSEYIYNVSWSRSRPTVLYAAAKGLLTFDLSSNNISPVSQMSVKEKTVVQTIARNSKQHNLIAMGDENGQVKIWLLPQHLTREKNSEANFFKNIESSKW